jgi:hypothetical protein
MCEAVTARNQGYLVTVEGAGEKNVQHKAVRLGTLSPTKIWAQRGRK